MFEPSQRPYTYWIFCDESGNLSNNQYLIAAAVGTGDLDPLKKAVERASREDITKKGKRKKNKSSKKKGKHIRNQAYRHATDDHEIARYLLEQVAQIDDLVLYIALLDKYSIWNTKIYNNLPDYKNSLYNKLFTYLIQQAHSVKTGITMQSLVILEERDNRKTYEDDLKSKIKIATSLEEEQIQICNKNDKQWRRHLQVADSIAWSTFRKYMEEDESFFRIIHDKIELELILGVDNNGDLKPKKDMIRFS